MNISLKSTLLVPMSEFCNDYAFRWMDTFRGENKGVFGSDEVHVIVFNTEKKEEIRSLLEEDLAELKAYTEPDDNVANQIQWIEGILKKIGVPGFEHPCPDALLDALASASGKSLTKGDVIYLSGVSSMG